MKRAGLITNKQEVPVDRMPYLILHCQYQVMCTANSITSHVGFGGNDRDLGWANSCLCLSILPFVDS